MIKCFVWNRPPGLPSTYNKEMTLSVGETAELIGISPNACYEAIRRGIIPSIRIGGRILISRKQIEMMFEPKPTEYMA